MCLLGILFRVVADAPVIVGANREEFYARGGIPPQIVEGPCPFLAGIDPQGGGTWLGVNAHGVLAATTNRNKAEMPAQPRSRGLLTRDLLGCKSASVAVELACRELGTNRYAGCNILIADQNRADIIQAGDWLRVRPLPPGLHVLANRDVNDGSDPRLAFVMARMEQQRYDHSEQCLAQLKSVCAHTDNPAICWRGPERGTVSSTLIALAPDLRHCRFLHAQGPPDVTQYEDLSYLLRRLSESVCP
jgi:uncharacterized protein with NRDE domain